MAKYADVDKLMKHSISLDWSILKWVNEVDICYAIKPNVVERKKGKWKQGCCSECGYNWGKDAPIANVPNFCPNCGAKMDGKE